MQKGILLTQSSVISALKQYRDNFYKFGKHIHNSFEVYHFLSGECEMDIRSKTIHCVEGDYVIIMPNIVHSLFLETEKPCTFNHIHFEPEFFTDLFLNGYDNEDMDLLTALIFRNNSYFKVKADEQLAKSVSTIIEIKASDTHFADAYMNLELTKMLLHILEKSGYSLILSKKSDSKNKYVTFTTAYIQEHYAEKILINDIADALNISSRYLSKVFFEQTNVTILNYLNIYRINQAIDLMINTNLTLTEISAQIGLKDSQHFSKLFNNVIGLPPYKYRKLLRS